MTPTAGTRRALGLAGTVLAVLTLAGCGSNTAPGTGGGGSTGTSLTITVRATADATPQSWTLTCDPAGGTHPDPTSACTALAASDDPFKPVPKDVACTQIYGGPQTATVTGTYKGQPVNATFNRTNGCEIARWDRLVSVLVVQGGA